MASISSATAVEQLLGRVLRQPEASHRHAPALNQSYAFVVSRHFAETAGTLRDRLVTGADFERREVGDFVTAAKPDQGRLDLAGHAGRFVMQPVSTRLTEKPDLKTVPKTIRDKVNWDGKRNTLTINAPLAEDETELLKASVKSLSAATAIAVAAETSRTSALEIFQTPAKLGECFRIPQLALRVRAADGSEQLRLFDDPEVLGYPWNLSLHDAAPTADDIAALGAALQVSEDGEIDVDNASGKMVSRFLPEQSLTHAAKRAYVAAWLSDLLGRDGFNLARANLQKFLIRHRIEARIRNLRKTAIGQGQT